MNDHNAERLIWQKGIEILYLASIDSELKRLNRRIGKLATEAQVQAVADGVKAIQDAETIEEAQLTQIVTDLEAAAGNNPDPLLQTSIDALTHIRDSVAAFPGTLPSAPAPTP